MSIYQRGLLKILDHPLLPKLGKRFLHSRDWTIEGGVGRGLKVKLPQNREYLSGRNETAVQRELARHLRPGAVFYDIGANVGFFSIIAARLVGSSGCVCAFEPYPQNTASIRENAGLNGMPQIRVFEVAAGKNTRREDLSVSEWDGGATLSKTAPGHLPVMSFIDVQVVCLDEFIQEQKLPLPDVVKIDVEGYEREVLEGMGTAIGRAKPVLLYEVDDSSDERLRTRWDALDTYVAKLGYNVSHLESSYPNVNWKVGHSLAVPLPRSNSLVAGQVTL